MNIDRLIYLIVFTLAFGVGIYVYKYHKALRILVGLLALGLLTEYTVELNKYTKTTSEEFIYNIYIPLEYLTYAAFFYYINSHKYIRKAILLSTPLFIILILLLSEFKNNHITDLSSAIYIFGGVLTTAWSLWTLFVIKPMEGIKFRVHPLFWICIGLLIFYSVSMPFNVMFNPLKDADGKLYELLDIIIRKGLNVFLYVIFIIGFICSHRMKKL